MIWGHQDDPVGKAACCNPGPIHGMHVKVGGKKPLHRVALCPSQLLGAANGAVDSGISRSFRRRCKSHVTSREWHSE